MEVWQAFFKFKETYNVPVLRVRLPIKKNFSYFFNWLKYDCYSQQI